MKIILFLILLVIIVVALIFLEWSCYNWINAYKTADIRMSFGKFRRIYELAPSEWENDFDYIYRRVEWCSSYENGKGFCGTYISTSIAMRTLFDFWRLLHWQKEIVRKKEREERFKNEKTSLKNLTIMIERDAEDIRRKWEEEEQKAEKLRQEIIDRLGGNK